MIWLLERGVYTQAQVVDGRTYKADGHVHTLYFMYEAFAHKKSILEAACLQIAKKEGKKPRVHIVQPELPLEPQVLCSSSVPYPGQWDEVNTWNTDLMFRIRTVEALKNQCDPSYSFQQAWWGYYLR